MEQVYDRIGVGYARTRRPDPRMAAILVAALGESRTVLNVGAGAGSYEPEDRTVVSVEPSRTMLAQRRSRRRALRASAVALPFPDGAFDAAMAVLTVHHWPDRQRGLSEMTRVSRDGVAILTWDPDSDGFWLVRDYFPGILSLDRTIFPTVDEFRDEVGPIEVRTVPIPHDCVDGFLGAFWRRPEAYLDPRVRSGISSFARLPGAETALARLRDDLASGHWQRTNRDLVDCAEADLGYRLVVSGRLAKRSAAVDPSR